MTIFTNYDKIAFNKERENVLKILDAGVAGASAWELMSATIRFNATFKSVSVQKETFDLITGRIFVVGAGKATGAMAEALERIISPEHITAGAVNCHKDEFKTKVIKVHKAGHPLPDKNGAKGVDQMLELKDKYDIGKKDLVLVLISGGASSMLPAPAEGIKLKDQKEITDLLIKSGATIQEFNAVRKHISKVKGGLLAEHFKPATVVAVIVSDVVGDTPDAIGSGPTVMDTTTFKDAEIVLDKYNLKKIAPQAVVNRIELGSQGKIRDTPKIKDLAHNFIIGSNASALEAMAHEAQNMGLKPLISSSEIVGSPGKAARVMVTQMLSDDFAGYDVVLWGGETTPKLILKHGEGGRNQHFVAVFMSAMQGLGGKWVLAGMGTDGIDYKRGVAGAIIDQNSFALAMEKNIDISQHIKRYDTYTMFKKMKQNLLLAHTTGTNVRDVMVLLRKQE